MSSILQVVSASKCGSIFVVDVDAGCKIDLFYKHGGAVLNVSWALYMALRRRLWMMRMIGDDYIWLWVALGEDL